MKIIVLFVLLFSPCFFSTSDLRRQEIDLTPLLASKEKLEVSLGVALPGSGVRLGFDILGCEQG